MLKIEDLLSHGIALVPIPYGHKGPANIGWNASHNVLKHPDQAHLASNMNIGIAHANCSPLPTCAIDLDDYKASKKWLASKGVDLDALLYSPDAVVIHSGKVNSLKLLYTLPAGMPPMPSKSIKNPDTTMMVEFRCATAEGLTVQDILPPSIHPSGTQYKFIGGGSILAIPTIPKSLFDIWVELISANKTSKNETTVRTPPSQSPREIARVQEMLNHISADCNYETYRDVVWSVLSTGWTCAEQIAEDWCKTAPQRFDEVNFRNVVISYNPNKTNPITLGTLNFLAKKGGWNG
jgi:hypothetical protein